METADLTDLVIKKALQLKHQMCDTVIATSKHTKNRTTGCYIKVDTYSMPLAKLKVVAVLHKTTSTELYPEQFQTPHTLDIMLPFMPRSATRVLHLRFPDQNISSIYLSSSHFPINATFPALKCFKSTTTKGLCSYFYFVLILFSVFPDIFLNLLDLITLIVLSEK